jgi:hypothetical protein
VDSNDFSSSSSGGGGETAVPKEKAQPKKTSLFDASDDDEEDDDLFLYKHGEGEGGKYCENATTPSLFDSDSGDDAFAFPSKQKKAIVDPVAVVDEREHFEVVRQAQLERMRRMKLSKSHAPAPARGSRRIQRGTTGTLAPPAPPARSPAPVEPSEESIQVDAAAVEEAERQRRELKEQMDADRLRRQRNRAKLAQQQKGASKQSSPPPDSSASAAAPAVPASVPAPAAAPVIAAPALDTRPRRQSYTKFEDDEDDEITPIPIPATATPPVGVPVPTPARPALTEEEREHRLNEGIQAWAQYCCGDVRLMICYVTEVLDVTSIIDEFAGAITTEDGVCVVPWDPALLLQMVQSNVTVDRQDEYVSPSAVRKIYLYVFVLIVLPCCG